MLLLATCAQARVPFEAPFETQGKPVLLGLLALGVRRA